jgi:hypothetical protein
MIWHTQINIKSDSDLKAYGNIGRRCKKGKKAKES